jgi:hypothetical protein
MGPQDGPWSRDLKWLTIQSGTPTPPAFFLMAAGVPSLTRDAKGRIFAAFQWFPANEEGAFDRVAVSTSDDGGKSWTPPKTVKIEGMPEGLVRSFDPTLVTLDDGRIRMYFTSHPGANRQQGGNPPRPPQNQGGFPPQQGPPNQGGFPPQQGPPNQGGFPPQQGPPNQGGFPPQQGPQRPPDDLQIYSAISTDGINFKFEEGVRFKAEGEAAFDPAVCRFNGKWHLITPRRDGGANHATSADGLSFVRADPIPGDRARQFIGNLIVLGGKMRFYGSSPDGVFFVETDDGSAWSSPVPVGVRGGDPAVVETSNGSLLMLLVGEPRRIAMQRAPQPPPPANGGDRSQ